jgi:hypothetical protein
MDSDAMLGVDNEVQRCQALAVVSSAATAGCNRANLRSHLAWSSPNHRRGDAATRYCASFGALATKLLTAARCTRRL